LRIVKTITALLISTLTFALYAADPPVSQKLAEKAEVVLRGKRVSLGEGSKYIICEVQVSEVFTNRSGRHVAGKIEVAAYSWRPGVPGGESTFYLERYNETHTNLWRLVGGEASTGISHNKQ
jgi:hypothetical protein